MARLPRIVIPGYPHHVTQRGNRRARTFFEDGGYALYGALLGGGSPKGRGRDMVLLPEAQSCAYHYRSFR